MKVLFVGILFLGWMCSPDSVSAQSRWEIGLFGGISNYMGDLAPDPVFKESHPAYGIDVKRNANPYFSYSASMTYGSISGNDSNSANLAPRGLKFQSNIFEMSGQIEFNFFKFGTGETRGTRRFSPYVFTGLSVFHFDPEAVFDGVTYHLQLQTTEGQGFAQGAPKPYKLWQLAIPIGGGLKFNISNRFNLLMFAGYRATFTNYLDDVGGNYASAQTLVDNNGDVSANLADPTKVAPYGNFNGSGLQRTSTGRHDWYMFYGITLSYLVPGPLCPNPY